MTVRAWMLFGVLLVLVFIQQVLAIEPEPKYIADNRIAKEVFRAACRISQYDCDGLKRPVIRRSPELYKYGVNGLYIGGKTLWLADELPPIQTKLTMFHEMIHYLQFVVGKLEPHFSNQLSGCVVEREAYEFTKQFALEIKAPVGYIDTLEDWQNIYRCKVG